MADENVVDARMPDELAFTSDIKLSLEALNVVNGALVGVLSYLSTLSPAWNENPELEKEFRFLVNLHSQDMHALAILNKMRRQA